MKQLLCRIDIWEKEETDLFILSLREEIVQKCLNTIYENYLNRQVVTFTVHCAYLAWVKAIGVSYHILLQLSVSSVLSVSTIKKEGLPP